MKGAIKVLLAVLAGATCQAQNADQEKDPLFRAQTIKVTFQAGTSIEFDKKTGAPKVSKLPRFAPSPHDSVVYQVALARAAGASFEGEALKTWIRRGTKDTPDRWKMKVIYAGRRDAVSGRFCSTINFHDIDQYGAMVTTVFNKKNSEGKYLAVHTRHDPYKPCTQHYHGTAVITKFRAQRKPGKAVPVDP